MTLSQKNNRRRKLVRPLLATALALGGVFNMVGTVLADGTAAGTEIDNTATATYNDPNDPDNPLTSTSNTVTVTVAEVAGITVAASGIDDVNGGTVDPGDELYYQFTVTNVGNDTTDFRIPDTVDISGPGTLTPPAGGGAAVQVSYDGGVTWVDVPPGGLDTDPLAPGGSVLVRANVAVNTAGVAPGDTITVQLGNTPGDGQNQPFVADGGDVFTVDSEGDPGDTPGAPVNGTREASATQGIEVAATAETKALVTIEKVMSDHQPNDLAIITDDQVTYDLGFTVEDQPPLGSSVTPGPLLPQGGISVAPSGGALTPGSYILVSDAVPSGTSFVSSTAPAGWTPVYSDQTVTGAGVADATELNWYEDQADVPGGVVGTVGFINTAAITSIAPGAAVNTFRMTVVTDQVTNASAVIANMAQVFGSSVPDDPNTPGDESNDPTNTVVDESGDQTPSNYNTDTDTFDPPSDGELPDGDGDDVPDDIDPNDPNAGDGTDPSNNNTGSGPGGEANILPLAEAPPSGVTNGPDNFPGATGPTDTNDDFTNKSVNVPDSTPGATNDPSPVNFTNTVQNSGQSTGDIVLLPTPPSDPAELPAGTIVTIVGPGTTGTATYEWDGTSFVGVGGGAPPAPVVVPAVDPGDTVDYGVQVDLPAGTPLSTDASTADGGPEDADGIDEPGFPVPVTALIDTTGGADPATVDFSDPANPVLGDYEGANTTIDRVYTGFLKLVKESRILQGDGPAPLAGEDVFSDAPKTPSEGNIIEYRVTYSNVSEPLSGTNNVIL
ncbi:MAG: hypothetical protein AAFZ80_05420, partial [Cyanobacteria bacterium P01_A01_bin.105]